MKNVTLLPLIEPALPTLLFPVGRLEETFKAVLASSGTARSEFMSFYSLVAAVVCSTVFFFTSIIGLIFFSLVVELIAFGILLIAGACAWVGRRHLRLYETNLQRMFQLNYELLSSWFETRYNISIPKYDIEKIIASPYHAWSNYNKGIVVELRYNKEEGTFLLVDSAGQELPHS